MTENQLDDMGTQRGSPVRRGRTFNVVLQFSDPWLINDRPYSVTVKNSYGLLHTLVSRIQLIPMYACRLWYPVGFISKLHQLNGLTFTQ
jgi:hypothetical protein